MAPRSCRPSTRRTRPRPSGRLAADGAAAALRTTQEPVADGRQPIPSPSPPHPDPQPQSPPPIPRPSPPPPRACSGRAPTDPATRRRQRGQPSRLPPCTPMAERGSNPHTPNSQVVWSQGQPWRRAQRSSARWSPPAAVAEVAASQGQPCWRAHRNTFKRPHGGLGRAGGASRHKGPPPAPPRAVPCRPPPRPPGRPAPRPVVPPHAPQRSLDAATPSQAVWRGPSAYTRQVRVGAGGRGAALRRRRGTGRGAGARQRLLPPPPPPPPPPRKMNGGGAQAGAYMGEMGLRAMSGGGQGEARGRAGGSARAPSGRGQRVRGHVAAARGSGVSFSPGGGPGGVSVVGEGRHSGRGLAPCGGEGGRARRGRGGRESYCLGVGEGGAAGRHCSRDASWHVQSGRPQAKGGAGGARAKAAAARHSSCGRPPPPPAAAASPPPAHGCCCCSPRHRAPPAPPTSSPSPPPTGAIWIGCSVGKRALRTPGVFSGRRPLVIRGYTSSRK
jgi:hypothetical protein